MAESFGRKVADLICEDCDHQGQSEFPCAKQLPCVYAEGLADQIISLFLERVKGIENPHEEHDGIHVWGNKCDKCSFNEAIQAVIKGVSDD